MLYVHLLRFFGWCSTVVVPLWCRLPAIVPVDSLGTVGWRIHKDTIEEPPPTTVHRNPVRRCMHG